MAEVVRLRSPAFPKNRGPILGLLERCWGQGPRRVLEVASGPGEHVCWFAAALPEVTWQPSERDAAQVASIDAWARESGASNVLPARRLDAGEPEWGVGEGAWDGALAINVVHMVDEATVKSLLRGFGRALKPGAAAIFYDCFSFEGGHLSAANAAFDARLRANTPGRLYALEELTAWAAAEGLGAPTLHQLPSNNQGLVLRRAPTGR